MTGTISILRGAIAAGVLAICMTGAVSAAAGGEAPATPADAAATADPAEDIRDIRGPKRITPGWLLPVLLCTALLAVAAYLLQRRDA